LELRALLTYCQSTKKEMFQCLRRAVEIESPTSSKAGIDCLAEFIAREFRRLHGKVRVLRHPTAGSSVWAEFWG
jgi:hypothetical protein